MLDRGVLTCFGLAVIPGVSDGAEELRQVAVVPRIAEPYADGVSTSQMDRQDVAAPIEGQA